jgi:protein-S-isoprenylcysteine O-methyltransferase Ste14
MAACGDSHDGFQASIMTPLLAKMIWCLGIVGWFVLRYPHSRRSRRMPKLRGASGIREPLLLILSATGLGVVPGIYVFGNVPRFANYSFRPIQAWLGLATFAAALWLFRSTHKALGHNWSMTLEVRVQHALITQGPYRWVRHPMYSAFWLWAIAQALLLPNWFAGFTGLIGFGTLFFLRVGREERLMIETFGDDYRRYMARTWRVLPGVY